MKVVRRKLDKEVDSTPNWQQPVVIKQRSVIVDKVSEFMMAGEVPLSVCDGIVDFFHHNDNYKAKPGVIGGDRDAPRTNDAVKQSMDMTVHTSYGDFDDRIRDYLNCLDSLIEKYHKTYRKSAMSSRISPKFNIQHYEPGGGYKTWHFERTGRKGAIYRHLVWMTYLTDNPDGGTQFLYQDLNIPAERGKTLIWPAEWMFTHKSRVDPEREKMIITGWTELL